MRPPHRIAAAALMLAMLAGDVANLSFAPASANAQWSHGGTVTGYPSWHHGYGKRRYDRVDAGDVIATVAVIAGIAAVASASQADRGRNGGWDDDRGGERRHLSSRGQREDIAISRCRAEAERQARAYGTSASLRDIHDVASRKNAVYVRGLAEIAKSEPVPGGTERRLTTERFACVVRSGVVETYQLTGAGDFATRW